MKALVYSTSNQQICSSDGYFSSKSTKLDKHGVSEP